MLIWFINYDPILKKLKAAQGRLLIGVSFCAYFSCAPESIHCFSNSSSLEVTLWKCCAL
jgi:hypothetical protein